MTDKELKKLSKLELLELLLAQTRENERLREELAKAKQENSIEKSALLLNETIKQLDEVFKKVSSTNNTTSNIGGTSKQSPSGRKVFTVKKSKKS